MVPEICKPGSNWFILRLEITPWSCVSLQLWLVLLENPIVLLNKKHSSVEFWLKRICHIKQHLAENPNHLWYVPIYWDTTNSMSNLQSRAWEPNGWPFFSEYKTIICWAKLVKLCPHLNLEFIYKKNIKKNCSK